MEEILRKLIAFPTTSGDRQAMHELLDYVADFVMQRGMRVEWFDSNGFESIVALPQAQPSGFKTPKVMLGAHADVVPAEESMFVLRSHDGKYYGRGVLDMKFAIAAYLQIIDDLQDHLDEYDIGLMLTSDEEVGGADGVGSLVDKGYLPKVCILPDGGDNWQIQTKSKGILVYEIGVSGVSSHGARPWLGDNAIPKLLTVLDEIASLFPRIPTEDTNTLSLTKINSGKALTQIPDKAVMTIDVRTISGKDYQEIDHKIREICQRNQASCICISSGAPTSFSLEDPYIQPFATIASQVLGAPVRGFFAIGASDARYFVPYGVPIISVYPLGGGLHSDNEWVDVTGVQQFTEITRQYLDIMAHTAPLS